MPKLLFLICLPVFATDWLTFGGNAQRTGHSTDENEISQANVKNMKLAWKIKLDTMPQELNSLTTPIVIEKAVTPKGFKELIIVAGADNTVFAIDGDNGSIFWKTKLAVEGQPKGYINWLCHAGLNATPTVHKPTRSLLVVAADGKLHDINYVSGDEQKPAKQFVPPYSKPYSLVVYEGVLYAPTGQGCGQNKNGVYAMDLMNPERPVTSFQVSTAGAGIWGRAGLAITSAGVLIGETGDGPFDPEAGKWSDTFLGLNSKTLTLADSYTPQNRAWITKKDLDLGCMSPVVFTYKGRELVAGGGKEGVLYLLDAKKLGGSQIIVGTPGVDHDVVGIGQTGVPAQDLSLIHI